MRLFSIAALATVNANQCTRDDQGVVRTISGLITVWVVFFWTIKSVFLEPAVIWIRVVAPAISIVRIIMGKFVLGTERLLPLAATCWNLHAKISSGFLKSDWFDNKIPTKFHLWVASDWNPGQRSIIERCTGACSACSQINIDTADAQGYFGETIALKCGYNHPETPLTVIAPQNRPKVLWHKVLENGNKIRVAKSYNYQVLARLQCSCYLKFQTLFFLSQKLIVDFRPSMAVDIGTTLSLVPLLVTVRW